MVKSNNDDDGSTTTTDDDHDEYVTNFYRQKRQAKRDYLAAAAKTFSGGGRMDSYSNSRGEANHNDYSLNHYFNHDRRLHHHHHEDRGGDVDQRAFIRRSSINNGSGGGGNSHDDNDGLKRIQPAFVSKQHDHTTAQQHARVASSVRGGSIVAQQGRRKHSKNYNCYYGSDNNKKSGNGRLKDQRNHHDAFATSTAHHHHRRRRHGHSHQTHHHHEEEEESDVDQFLDNHDKEYLQATAKSDYSSTTNDDNQHDDDPNNNSAPPIHQGGLLRIPCSIRLNSNKAGHSSHHHHPSSFTPSTPIAAYIDTGAQVTVISASAARKVGILHLMDRRYAGRATGVGSCRILGRIPAGCVQFVLGHYDDDDEGEVIEMNGPALTVLEGTVTQGVDMLVGLDVLQDWEATIRMGGSSTGMGSSMMVRKCGRKDPVVLPFLVGSSSSRGRVGVKSRHRSATGAGSGSTTHHRSSSSSIPRQQQQRSTAAKSKSSYHYDRRQQQEEEEVEHDYSPVTSDIESDLDILDQSEFTHGFPESGARRARMKQCSDEIVHDIEREDELLGVRHSQHYLREERDNDDDFLQDSSDEDEDEGEELDFDMSGL